MAKLTLSIQGEPVEIDCAPGEERRMEDLAAALSRRLEEVAAFEGGSASGRRVLILAALGLMDESQRVAAALARARAEIDRLNDAPAAPAPGGEPLRRPA